MSLFLQAPASSPNAKRFQNNEKTAGSPWSRFSIYGELRLKTRRSFFTFCSFHGKGTHIQRSFTIYGERSNPLKLPHRLTKGGALRPTNRSTTCACVLGPHFFSKEVVRKRGLPAVRKRGVPAVNPLEKKVGLFDSAFFFKLLLPLSSC